MPAVIESMSCPWCDWSGSPRQLHAHLGADHPDAVSVIERGSRKVYIVTCPICGDSHEQAIKPRLRDSGFLDEFGAEIRLVAFDMLINHLLVEHEIETSDDTREETHE